MGRRSPRTAGTRSATTPGACAPAWGHGCGQAERSTTNPSRTAAASVSGCRSRSRGAAASSTRTRRRTARRWISRGAWTWRTAAPSGSSRCATGCATRPARGTWSAAPYSLQDESGQWREFSVEAAGTPADVQGLGYYGGWKDGGSAGLYRGAGPVVEFDRYPSAAAAGKTGLLSLLPEKRLGPTEFPCVIEGPGGARGMAHVEQHFFGAYKPYGM